MDPTSENLEISWVVNGQRLKHYMGDEVHRLKHLLGIFHIF